MLRRHSSYFDLKTPYKRERRCWKGCPCFENCVHIWQMVKWKPLRIGAWMRTWIGKFTTLKAWRHNV